MNSRFNNLASEEYGRYRDDAFAPWSHDLDNLDNLDDFFADIYPVIRFPMSNYFQ